jgi:hypothetical protein
MASGLPEVRLAVISRQPSDETSLRHLGAADNAAHKIYIWDINNDGQYASTLDGGREPLIHIHVGIHFFSRTMRPRRPLTCLM